MFFTKTSISALRALLYLAREEADTCISPRRLAEALGESPTYLAKVVRHLVKAGILQAEKGVKGGVRLVTPPGQVSLLAVVEACQGTVVGDYCLSTEPEFSYCGFHHAAQEIHDAITGILSRWSLEQILVGSNTVDRLHRVLACTIERAPGAAARRQGERPVFSVDGPEVRP